MTALSAVCQWRRKQVGAAGGGSTTPRYFMCGKSARWVRPDGDVVTILLYEEDTGLSVSLCCARDVSKAFYRDVQARYPGFPEGWSPEPEQPPTAEQISRQKWMRHALVETARVKVGGLVFADNSAVTDERQPSFLRRIG